MDLIRSADPAAFAHRVESFLLWHEAEHNLALGIIGGLHRLPQPAPQPSRQPPYLALVEDAARRTVSDRIRARGLSLWEAGQPVAMANAGGATPHGIRINLV